MRKRIESIFSKLKKLKICIIGDTIIDEYVYVYALGTASKDPVLSTRKTSTEFFAGGVLAVANHISRFCKSVELISVIGENDSKQEFISNRLNENINSVFFYKKNADTLVKTRFLEEKRLTKLFKMENSDGEIIPPDLEEQILNQLKKNLSSFDLVIIADFGHGLMTRKIRDYVTNNASYLSINVQTNSSNFGFNPLSRYERADFVSLNHKELQMYFQDNEYQRNDLLDKLIQARKYDRILLTASKDGVLYYNGSEIISHKAFTTRPVDTIGAGDAVFSFGSLLGFLEEDDIIPKMSNIVGAIAVETIGNRESISESKIIDFIINNPEEVEYELESI